MIEPLAVSEGCIAIGECGFDLYYEHSPVDEQETAFRWQIRLATRVEKPLVIHSRDAWDDTFRVLDDEGVPDRTIFHCFTGGAPRPSAHSNAAATSRSAESFRSRTPKRCERRRGSRPRIGFSSRPIPRSWRPSRTGAGERACVRHRGRRSARPGPRRRTGRDRRADARERGTRVCRYDVTLTVTQVRELLARHDLRPSKALGQNFLADPNTARRIVRLAEIARGDRVVEVGPGIGSLTLALADEGARVRAVELDRHLVPVLREVVGDRDVEIIEADALHGRLVGGAAHRKRGSLVDGCQPSLQRGDVGGDPRARSRAR